MARTPERLGQSWGTSPDPFLVPRVGSEHASHSNLSPPLAALGKPLSWHSGERSLAQQNTHLPYADHSPDRGSFDWISIFSPMWLHIMMGGGQCWGMSPNFSLVPWGSERASHSNLSPPLAALGKPLSWFPVELGFA